MPLIAIAVEDLPEAETSLEEKQVTLIMCNLTDAISIIVTTDANLYILVKSFTFSGRPLGSGCDRCPKRTLAIRKESGMSEEPRGVLGGEREQCPAIECKLPRTTMFWCGGVFTSPHAGRCHCTSSSTTQESHCLISVNNMLNIMTQILISITTRTLWNIFQLFTTVIDKLMK